jgi:hypothetical protein
MRNRVLAAVALALCACFGVARGQAEQTAQQTPPDERGTREPRVGLSEAAVAYDAEGRVALGARLSTSNVAGSVDAPVRNVRLVVQNRGAFFYNYASGWATFYDAQGVRCGEGLWKVEAFAPGESAEVDTPGLRLTCAPATWRVVALNLLTRTTDIAKPGQPAPPAAADAAAPPAGSAAPPPDAAAAGVPQRLEININGRTLPLQLNNPVEVQVGRERVLIVVRPAP